MAAGIQIGTNMHILVTIFVVIIVLALVIFGIRQIPFVEPLFQQLLILLAVIIAVYFIVQRAGLI